MGGAAAERLLRWVGSWFLTRATYLNTYFLEYLFTYQLTYYIRPSHRWKENIVGFTEQAAESSKKGSSWKADTAAKGKKLRRAKLHERTYIVCFELFICLFVWYKVFYFYASLEKSISIFMQALRKTFPKWKSKFFILCFPSTLNS